MKFPGFLPSMASGVGGQISSQILPDLCVQPLLFLTAKSAAVKGILRCKLSAISRLCVWFQFFHGHLCTFSRRLSLTVCSIHACLEKPFNALVFYFNSSTSIWSSGLHGQRNPDQYLVHVVFFILGKKVGDLTSLSTRCVFIFPDL